MPEPAECAGNAKGAARFAGVQAIERRAQVVVLALQLFALAIPVDLATRSLTGVLQAAQRYGRANAISAAGTLATYGAYAVGILLGNNFRAVIYGLLVSLILLLGAMLGHFFTAFPSP